MVVGPRPASDRISWIGLSSVYLPLRKSVSDAKVLTGKQKPLEGVSLLFAEIEAGIGHRGMGFSYSLRSGGPGQFAHAKEIAPELIGDGEGRGFNVNCGLPGGQGDGDYAAVFESLFLPIFDQYRPDFVVVSAGFDPHRADPLGGMRVTERGFAAMCSALKSLAERHANGRLVLLLEGGYDLDGLAQSVHACVEVLAGARSEALSTSGATAVASQAVDDTWAALKTTWKR